ncbi:unnamed protein product, partial [Linum tenue]
RPLVDTRLDVVRYLRGASRSRQPSPPAFRNFPAKERTERRERCQDHSAIENPPALNPGYEAPILR